MKKVTKGLVGTLSISLLGFVLFTTSLQAQVISTSTSSSVVIAGGQDFVVNSGVVLSDPFSPAVAGSSSTSIVLENFTNNGSLIGSNTNGTIMSAFNSSFKTNFINNGIMSGKGGITFFSAVNLTNNLSKSISGTDRAIHFQSGSSGTDLVNNGSIQGNYSSIRVYSGVTINSFTNNSTGSIGGTGCNNIIGIENGGTITTLINYGSIRNCRSDLAAINGSSATITTLKNYGVINNNNSTRSISGTTVTNLYNSQNNFNFDGNLPTNYYIYIDGTNTGKITFTNPGASTLNFAIDPASNLATGTYTAVLNGISSSNIVSGTSGVFGGKLWTLTNPTGTQWNLVVTENVSPIIGNLNGDQVAWAGVGSNVTLDVNGNATLSDENFAGLNGGNGDWAGATLTVQRPTVVLTSDVFGFDTTGAPFTVSGSNLQSGGLTFATFTNSNGVLAISFTSSGTAATTALVNSVAQRITYRNDTPAGDANIRFALNDGSGTAITNADVLVTTDFIYVTNSTNTATIDLTNGVSFSEAIAIAAADATGAQQIVFASNLAGQSLTVGTNSISEDLGFDMDLASGITLAGGTLTSAAGTTLTFSNGTGDNATLTAVLAGDGAIKKSGLGVVNLRASNTFRGITTISGGTISIGLDDNLGTPPATPTPGHLVLENGGILKFVNVTTPWIAVNSNRGILLNGTGGEFDVSSGTEPGVSSIIAGTGSLTKSGPSQIRVDGANTYSGGTIVNSGTLFGGAGSMSKTSFGVGTITINATGVLWGDRNVLSNPITLNGGKLLGTNGFGEIWNGPITLQTDSYIEPNYAMIVNGQISGPGKLILTGSHPTNSRLILTNTAIHTGGTELTRGILQLGNNGTTGELLTNVTTTVNSQVRFSRTNTFTYPGIISGPGGVNKISAGTVILSGVHTYTGTTLVEDGTLLINGSTSSQTNVIPVANRTSTLGGIGTINGNVSFQTRGILNPGNTIGALTINGNLTMVTGSTFAVDLNGATVGTENDQIVVNGTVDITGATLTVNHNNTGGGTLYTILVNDQSDAVTGTFNGIAEGTLITAAGNGALLSASYTTNGTGNDIVFVNRFSPILGRGQTANVKEAVALPPTVQVSNADGTPASNTTITFATTTGKVNTPYLANSASWYSTGGSLVSNVDWKAHVFTTGNDPVSIDQISLVLNSSDPINFPYPLSVTAEAALYQVSNGLPTQEIQSSGSQTIQLNNSGTWKNFDFATPVSLSPQTQYAIVVRSGDATGFKWANVRALSTVAEGIASTSLSLSSANGGGQWTTAVQNNAYALRSVSATASSVTVTTNANGIATLGKWVLGDRQGSQTLTVTSASLPNHPLTFAATAVAVLPSAPTNLVVTPGLGSVSIAFTPGYDGGANLSNYQYSLNNGSTWTSFSPAQTTSPVSITGLTNGVTYTIQLRGVNSIGQGAASAAVSATPIKPISDPSITVDPLNSQTFTGSSITPTLVVRDGNTQMVLGTDYSVAYSANTNVGTATVTLTGLGSYNGTRSVTFAIIAKDASTLTIDAIANQTYTGSALIPAVVVKDGNTTLTATTDYTVAYTNNTNVGTATVTITGAGNYSGTKTQTFTIVAKAASTLTIDAIANQTYTGSALTPAVVVKDGNTTLTATTDYTVAYTNNTNVGTATVTITGVGNYSGTKTQTFTIVAKAASTLTIDAIANQTYSGSALTPAIVVKDGNTTLTATTDYTVAYTNNTNVGLATVTITGVGNYTGTKTQTFTIGAKAASTLTIDAIANQTYTGAALTPVVVVKDGNTTLTATTDYTVAYTNNTNVGTATVTITGVGNYSGTKTQTFTIGAKAASTLTIDAIANQTYTGSALTPVVVVKDGNTTLTATTDYTVAYTNNTNVGTATVTITGVGNYSGTKTQTFTIGAKAASTLTIDAIANQTYTGSALTPVVVVKDGNTTLTATTDYAVAYTNNTNVGTATVTITGVGNYSGTKTQTFTIVAKAASSLTIDAISNQTYTGSALTPVVVVKDGNTTLTATTDYAVAYTNNTNVGTATVTITGAGNYTGTKTQTFTIVAKAASSLTIDAIANQTYTGSALTPVVVVKDGNTTLTATTDYTVAYTNNTNVGTATVTITGVGSYSGTKSQTFAIQPKALTIRAVNATKIYGDANPSLGFTYSGLVDGDTEIDQVPSISTTATTTSGVGTYRIILTGGSDPNYTLTRVEGVLEVTPASLSLTVNGATKIYGQADPVYTYSIQGLKGADTEAVLRGTLSREAGEEPGTYRIGAGTLSAGANYSLSVTGANLQIVKARAIAVAELGLITTEWSKEAALPATVNVLTTHGQYFRVDVKWDKTTLNLLARGTYALTGTLLLPAGIENPDQVLAKAQVRVLPKAAPLDLSLNNSSFVGSTNTFFIPVGPFIVNDPVDNIHVVGLFGDGYDNKYFEIKNNILFWSSADRAPGKTKFSIVVRVTDRDGNTIEKFFEITRTRKDFSSLIITNSFTPNGDGANEMWGVPELRFYEGVRINIFDKGGERVFYTENPDVRWDGTFEGRVLPVGGYFWTIEILETGEMRRGMLNLIRK